MKKFTSTFLALIVLILSFSVSAFAQEPVTISLQNEKVYAGDTFTVNVFISDNSMVSGAVIDINYGTSSFSERFMMDLTGLFAANNFIVLSQHVNTNTSFDFDDSFFTNSDLSLNDGVSSKSFNIFGVSLELPTALDAEPIQKSERPKKEKVMSSFSLVGDDLRELPFDVTMFKENNCIVVELVYKSTENKGKSKQFKIDFQKRFELFEIVYDSIVKTFKLDCTRRLKRIFSLVAGFEEKYISFIRSEQHLYKCYLGNVVFEITMIGSMVTVSLNEKTASFSYFDNIYDAATVVRTVL